MLTNTCGIGNGMFHSATGSETFLVLMLIIMLKTVHNLNYCC